jgi:hypothetical protein
MHTLGHPEFVEITGIETRSRFLVRSVQRIE